LGIRSGATPRGRIYSNPTPSALLRKADISTLLGIGHFYFALTKLPPTGLGGRFVVRRGFRASNPVQASILRFGRDTAKWAARICKECRFP
jgi:hypothetical protein